MKQHEIIHIADVISDAQLVLDVVVQGAEIDVGEQLAGEVADGHTHPVARAVDDAVDEGQRVRAGDLAPDQGLQGSVIHAVEILGHVSLEAIDGAPAPRGVPEELRRAQHACQYASAGPAGVTVPDERPLENWFDDVT